MTNDELRAARLKLGLTQAQLAAMLDSSPRYLRKVESPTDTSQHTSPPPRWCRLVGAYLAGYRPPDWPMGVK